MIEDFELRLHDKGNALIAALVLTLFEADKATEKSGGKWGYGLSLWRLKFWNNSYIANKSGNNLCKIYSNRFPRS